MQVTTQQRRSQKSVSGGRPRGRPPISSKFIQTINNTHMTQNQTDSKMTISNDAYISRSCNLSNSPYINSFLNQKMLSVMFGSGVNTNMLEYLNQVGNYQNVIRQYQNNLNTNPGIEVNYCKKETNQQSPHQILSNISAVENCLSSVKDRKDISITPVTFTNSNMKSKSVDLLSSHESRNNPSISLSVSKPVQRLQYSSLNQTSSQMRQSSLPLIADIQKSLSIHSLSSDNIPSDYCTTNALKDQFTILPAERRSCTTQNLSLQHKLLSKKQRQQLYESSQQFDSIKKHKPHRVITSSTNSGVASYSCPTAHSITEGNGYLNSSNTRRTLSCTQKPIQSNISLAPSLATSTQNTNNSFSMISQLQQQSHLEIIPQTSMRSETENMFKRTFPEPNQSELSTLVKRDSTLVFELPKQKVTIPFTAAVRMKKQDKCKNDKVEIITLED